MARYHPVLVALHWLMALMIGISLVAGGFLLPAIPADNPEKLMAVRMHMIAGLVIGSLLVARFVTRIVTAHPPRASAGNAFLDRIAVWTHWLFYFLIAGMALSGLATALGSDLFALAFGGAEDAVFPDLSELPQRTAHGVFARLLALLIALHLAAALYHQFVLKDGLFRRIWFGKRA